MKKFIVLLICIICITGCGNSKKEEKKEDTKNTDAIKFKEEYEQYNKQTINDVKLKKIEINENNPIYYASIDDIYHTLDNSGIILFCKPTSQECREIIPTLLDVAKNNGVKKIKYINPDVFSDMDQIIEKIAYDFNDVPLIIFKKDADTIGMITKDDIINQDENKKLKQKINYYIEQIYSDYCDETC